MAGSRNAAELRRGHPDNAGARRPTITSPPRDRFLLVIALLAFALWLAAIGPARTWEALAGLRARWIVGVAPSFLAGFTFVHWQAFITRSGPVASAAAAVGVVTLAEVAQLFLPRYTADVWDVVAGIGGAALAMSIVGWRARKHSQFGS